jgi:soluble lytic murein transglycosylase
VSSLAVLAVAVLRLLLPPAYWALAQDVARPLHLDPRLVLAVMKAESDFRPDVVSRAGAIGLMQVMPSTAAWLWRRSGERGPFTPERLLDPAVNARIGAFYLAYLMRGTKGNLALALAAYNSGPQNAARWTPKTWHGTVRYLAVVSYPETRYFIVKVLLTYLGYRLLLPLARG